MRAPTWAIVLVLLLIVGLGVYGYFTAPLPFGLNNVFRTPGGGVGPAPSTPQPVTVRMAAGQPLTLGLVTVNVQALQRSVDLTTGGRTGPAGSFTVLLIQLVNGGSDALTLEPSQFRLVDDRGRTYTVDIEATRAAAQALRRRAPFEATVPPSGRLETELVFEVPTEITALTLRVNLGYGEVDLPRQ